MIYNPRVIDLYLLIQSVLNRFIDHASDLLKVYLVYFVLEDLKIGPTAT